MFERRNFEGEEGRGENMDLEGFAKRMLKRGAKEEEIISEMRKRILEIKDVSEDYAERLASAVLEEAKCTLRVFSEVKTTKYFGACFRCRIQAFAWENSA
ncbi:MAG: Hydrogenase maturation factor HypE [Methanophagales archaeon]|nr:hypothetical protein [Methanophagales archaeon]MCU4140317.1 Hydrogenase maturation factor HypE [Methanophagales archaeon]